MVEPSIVGTEEGVKNNKVDEEELLHNLKGGNSAGAD